MRFKRWAALGVVPLLVALSAPSVAQTEENAYFVQVGGVLSTQGKFDAPLAEGRRFYPGDLMVHKGDTISFSVQGFHAVAVLPTGTNVDEWVAENITAAGGAYSIVIPDPDDGPGEFKANTAVEEPSDTSCGTTDTPCVYNGTNLLFSGIPETEEGSTAAPTFNIRIQNNPGETFTVVSVIQPAMRMTVTLVDQNATADDPAAVSAEAGSQITEDTTAANRVHRRFKDKRVKKDGAWQSWVGIDRTNFSLFAMYPRKLSLRKGAKVRFNFTQLIHEPHTASMPFKTAQTTSDEHFFVPVCDPDGDDGTQPDTEPNFTGGPPCVTGELEIDIDALAAVKQGNNIFTGARDYENSGILGPEILGMMNDPWTVSIRKDGRYLCEIHTWMKGGLNVR